MKLRASAEPSSALACRACGSSERVARSDELNVTLCGDCFDERADATELDALLRAVVDVVRRYVVLPGDEERDALALFVAHTYAIDGAHATPYLLIKSPEKRSGKTRLQEVLELLVCRPWRVTAASEAAMYRKIAGDRPTLLLDEIDAIFGTFSERTEPIRALLNAGNRPGATVARCVGQRGDEVRDFNVYCAKALAGIDNGQRIPDTIRDRSITIAMRRKTVAERVRPFRFRSAKAETDTLRDQLEGWGERAVEALVGATPICRPSLTIGRPKPGSRCSRSPSGPARSGRFADETRRFTSARATTAMKRRSGRSYSRRRAKRSRLATG